MMKSGARHVLAFALALICCGLSSCRKALHAPVVAVIQSTGGTAYWNSFSDTLRAQVGQYGFTLKWYAPQSAADYEVQAASLNDAIQKHVDGIILTPSHQLVLAEGVRRAHTEGIPVVIVDSPIAVPPSDYATAISCSNDVIGVRAAQYFVNHSASLHVLTVGASPTLESTAQREDSFKRGLQRESSLERGVQHVSWGSESMQARYSLSDWARARQVTLDALAADPTINAIFSSDEFSTHGVLSALRSRTGNSKPMLIGVQNDPEAEAALRSGLMRMAISCDSASEAKLALEAMQKALKHAPLEKLIQTDIVSYTKSDLHAAVPAM